MKKSIELRNGTIIEGAHYSRAGVTHCANGTSVENKLIVRKNGKKFYAYK